MENLAFALENDIMAYDWGHPDKIRDFIGNPAGCPAIQAECWMGAHPKAPSRLVLGGATRKLDELIQSDAALYLGQAALDQGWDSLPFLFKLLAANKALSIQSHPSKARAIEGFARENAAGVSISASNRNYKDPNHKPEIVVAITEFLGLCGFRPAKDIAADFELLAAGAAKAGKATAAERFAALAKLASQNDLAGLTRAILELGAAREETVAALCELASAQSEDRFKVLLKTAKDYPGDAGLLFFIVLGLLKLNPGESFFAPAGVLHAYIEGFGLELMANSDNVLRGGLTPKYIDVEELMANLDVDAMAGLLTPVLKAGVTTYEAPTNEFRLDLVKAGATLEASRKAEIWICTEGAGEIEVFDANGASQKIAIAKGKSVYLTPAVKEVKVSADMARAYIP